jgi:hypothetical protein
VKYFDPDISDGLNLGSYAQEQKRPRHRGAATRQEGIVPMSKRYDIYA